MTSLLNLKKNKTKILIIVFLLNVFVISLFMTLNSISDRFVNHNKNIVYSISNMKYIITQSHLWLEEYLNGDKKEFIKINSFLNNAKNELLVLKEGGYIRNLPFDSKLNDYNINLFLDKIEYKINDFEKSIENRIKNKLKTGTIEDQSFDERFVLIIEDLDNLDRYVNSKFQKMYKKYNYIKNFIYVIIFFLIILALYFIQKYTKELIHSINLIKQQSLELIKANNDLEKKVKTQTEINIRNKEKIYQQEKLLCMNELIKNIAHHWRQPLSYISSIASSIEIGLIKESKDIEINMKKIVKKTNSLSNIIDYFTDTIKNENKVSSFTISELFNSINVLVKLHLDNENIKFNSNLETPDFVLMTYKNSLVSILISLINNARDILLERKVQNPNITINIFIKEGNLNIKISDNAGGIDENILARIFEPYFTTYHQSFNKGLSLYLNYEEITNKFNGEFSVENDELGAVFIISIPLENK